MQARYELHLYSNTGVYLRPVRRKISRLVYNPVVNGRGEFEATFSERMTSAELDLFQLNGRIAIWRKAGAFDPARLEMLGFVRDDKPEFRIDKRGVSHYTLRGFDQNDLLSSRICVPWHDLFWAPNVIDHMDQAMRFLAEHNIGASAGTGRDIVTSNGAGLTIAVEDPTAATACTTAGEIAFEHGGRNLLEALQTLATMSETFIQQDVGTAAVPCYFGMCADTDTSLTFRVRTTRWGMNHRADSGQPVYVGPGYGNLRMARWSHDRRNEVNAGLAIYAAHSYPGLAWAEDTTRINAAPLNRREAASPAGESQVDAVAAALVKEGKTKEVFTGTISDTAGCKYGVHWGLGDELSIDYLGRQKNVMVMGVRVTCEGGERETIEPMWEVMDDD